MNPMAMQQAMQGMQNYGQNPGAITPANLRPYLTTGFQRQAMPQAGWQSQVTPNDRAGQVTEL